ncbi:MAG: hypothetical protein ABIA97_04435 [Candidatus Omnitrophota bacterium]
MANCPYCKKAISYLAYLKQLKPHCYDVRCKGCNHLFPIRLGSLILRFILVLVVFIGAWVSYIVLDKNLKAFITIMLFVSLVIADYIWWCYLARVKRRFE